MPSSSCGSPSSESKGTFNYDVYLTTKDPKHRVQNFFKHILGVAGITTFIDEQVDGFKVHDENIERCRVVMVVFTPDFLRCRTCRERVGNIMRCHRIMEKPVLPVFFGVSQREVCEQIAASESDFESDSRNAIAEAASLSGFTVTQTNGLDRTRLDAWQLKFDLYSAGTITDYSTEVFHTISLANELSYDKNGTGNLIKKIDEYLFRDLPRHQVGLWLRVREVLALLKGTHIFLEDTIIVGIWGAGGIGKTTIVRDIYDRIGGHFECTSFLANIKDAWEKDSGRVLLQNQIEQVLYRRALIILDDVNQVEQLAGLCGRREVFGKGSLIFVTTRNKDILDHFVDKSHEMKMLDINESLSLFSWHAFKKFSPATDFVNISRKIITLCEGLPLALEVIGSLLHNWTKPEWKRVLNKLKGIPNGQIQQKLKISLDFLTDLEKDVFFNIASFYVGQSEQYVTQMLEGSRFLVEAGMHVILERCLVKVINGKIYVHNLLQEIERGTSPNKATFKYMYDVFLSFRGEDTRKSFISHLYTALKQSGIMVFMDEENIERGEYISDSLLQAIGSSRMSIIIFSKNYAGSSWCLQELEKIMKCHKTTSQEVFPIFYDVRPSEVRKQQNTFGKAWERFIMRPSTSKAKKLRINFQRALIDAANLSGWDMQNYRTEAELIDHVIETIAMKLDDNKSLFVAQNLVGLKSRVQNIIQLLSNKSNEVIIAGIWGMGGIGKTTIAKAAYNEIGQSFAGKSFLANVREVWKQNNGPVYLQEQLLSSILKRRRITLPNIEIGKTLIEEILCQKRVLVVLDDVNNEEQLKALCGSREWFGPGSRIIITTRDEHLLKILRVVHVYNIKEMDENESLELFSWHAFKQAIPAQDFNENSRRVVSYSGGLPLALEILGSHLFDKEILIWECILEKLQRIPNNQIHEKLKISYDSLSDHTEKDIFLDICCFFIGKDRSYTTQILNGCGLHAEIGINRLIELSLVKVGSKNKLDMHDLLRDMGREIIRQQSPEDPEKRTRLWFHDDVLDVLRNNIGTIAIKGLSLNMSRNNSLSLNTKAFKEMKKLRLLQLDHVQLAGDYGYLSKELRWLCLREFPLENLPMNISLEKIVAIDLKWSSLAKVWKKSQLLEWLKILNLSHSHHLLETPNFSKLPYIEKLIFKDCPHLSTVHPSIGDLKYITLLNLKDCKSLNHLPRSIYNLKSLKNLNLSGCSKIENLEEDIEQMESLTTLVANQTAITQVPFSLVRLKSIKYVSLCGYEGLSHDVFPSLAFSWMSPRIHSKSLIQAFGIMPSLIKGLLHPIFARGHKILKTRPSTSQISCRKTPALIDFHEQVHMERTETFNSSLTIHVGGFNEVINTLLKSISQGWSTDGGLDYSLPRDNYPNWLVFENEGSIVSFIVPQVIGHCLKGMVLYIIYSSVQDNMESVHPVGVMIKNFTKATMEFHKQDATTISVGEEWKEIISNLEPGNEMEITINFAHKYSVKKTTIYLVYVEETNKISMLGVKT